MPEVAEKRAALHTMLDKRLEDRRRELEDLLASLERERQEGHRWIDSAPDAILYVMGADGEPSHTIVFEAKAHPPVNGDKPNRVQLRTPIEAIIKRLPPTAEITTSLLHDRLMEEIPILKSEDQTKLKARIAVTLSHLRDKDFIEIKKLGGGSIPHVYQRKNKYKALIDRFPTEAIK